VSATPPSIVIVALVLGGPERVRVVLSSSSSSILFPKGDGTSKGRSRVDPTA
jgi:hypothetical protein